MVGAGSPVDPAVAGAGFTGALGGMMCFGAAAPTSPLPVCLASLKLPHGGSRLWQGAAAHQSV